MTRSGPGFLTSKAFVAVNDIGGKQNEAAFTRLGGRADLRKEINDINFTVSLTDATLRDYEAAPWMKDAMVTAEKRLNNKSLLGAGYDFGAQNAFVSVFGDTHVSNKPITGRATWFQRGNTVRAEADVHIDHRQKLWGTYTFNDAANTVNSTFVNLKERQGFIIDPFTVPIATAAATYTFKKDGYVIEPQYDFHKNSAYLSVARDKFFKRNNVKAHYAVKEEVAMVEFGYQPDSNDLPLAKMYIKGRAGSKGLGPLSLGFILDKALDL